MANIIVLDGYTLNPGDLSWSGFEALGQVQVYDRTPQEKTVERIGDSELILTNGDHPGDCGTVSQAALYRRSGYGV